MLLHPAASVCAIDFKYGASVQPASCAVKVALDPVPLVAYKSISGEAPFSGPVYTIGLSVGANVPVPLVAPLALAVSVAGTIASPVYARFALSLELSSSPAGGLSVPKVEIVVAPVVSLSVNDTDRAYVPVIVFPSASFTVTMNIVAGNAVSAAPLGTPEIASDAGIPSSGTMMLLV
jgi:hypothetical protein